MFGNDQNAHGLILAALDDVRFVAEFVDQNGDGVDLDAGLTLGGFLHLEGDQPGRNIHSQFRRLEPVSYTHLDVYKRQA